MNVLLPGPSHPNRPEDAALTAATFRVSVDTVAGWLDRGMPQTAGLIDPVLAADWIARNDLAACPLLARRWRLWFDWFRTALEGRDLAVRRLRIHRRHTLHLPGPADRVRWWIPRLPTTRGQRLCGDSVCRHPAVVRLPTSWRLDLPDPASVGDTVELMPSPGCLEPALAALVEEVAGSFDYRWRHHRPGEPWSLTGGTCLDAAMALGTRLSAIGRPWRIVAGVIARTAIAGPHLWIESEDATGPVRLDPSLPAILRALAPHEDWRPWVRLGGTDTRCVATVVGDLGATGIPGGMTAGGAVGEAVATVDNQDWNAWACQDAPCGVTCWQFTAVD